MQPARRVGRGRGISLVRHTQDRILDIHANIWSVFRIIYINIIIIVIIIIMLLTAIITRACVMYIVLYMKIHHYAENASESP